ncbi:NADPH-Fe(3+) oxidoreductase subunit beta [Fundidesulfovibrio magnetotacticus]|uniref:NADPH-Fe(3+) oxidoreductase subunit beta n=1 Tax=Fundidesulfovibrio magnetotacticus TaxID=2730080 RepID=A0A6V8LHJ2_9BACT|nr:pyridine nucleotide-disulfide oxidoreductase/dicluster-binding protein [Fundidesulfovibrio magnetotacticus]GFK92183.1 NADPH-Fe(3+) oxidoreductase subunit beta [Fundidesulfovibrio magnetotacticus]
MEQRDLRDWERRCIQEEQPACQAACPLHVDVRAFMERMRAGDHDGARKVLDRTMPLPGILARICDHPCENACIRRDAGGTLAVGELERACIRLARPSPKPLTLPGRGKRAAVAGTGLAALVCAWDLARKGHEVTLFCPDPAPGGRLRGLPPHILPPEALEREIERLRALGVVLRPGEAWRGGLEPDYDAAFVEHGQPGCPERREEVDAVTLSSGAPGVFHGGWPAAGGGLSSMAEAADGRRAAASIDRFMTGASLTAERDKEGACATRLFTSLEGVAPLPRLEPDDAQGYADPARASAEAARCLLCQCLECVKRCTYLERHKGYPKKYARQIYNNAAIVQGVHQANRMVNSCSLCGLCASVCPEGFSMAELCLTARRDMVERGKMPPSVHEFALEDMAFNNGPAFALARHEPGRSRSSHLFFPGCQLAASRPGHVESAYAFLRGRLEGGVGLMLGCCGAPALWSGREELFRNSLRDLEASWEALGRPRVVTACASCLALFGEHAPHLGAVSLWEVLDAAPLPEPTGARPDGPVAVHDPCTLRHAPGVRGAVRAVLARLGVPFEELPRGGERTECCGYGGLMAEADPELAREVTARQASQSPLDYAASCAMCRDRLARQGKRTWHALDFVFPGPLHAPEAAGPGLSDRQESRARLKAALLRDVWGEIPDEDAPQGPSIVLGPEAAALLEDRRILREDLRAVLAHARASGAFFTDRSTGRSLASLRPRRVTFWALYSPSGEGFEVHRAWSHRMEVPPAAAGEAGKGSAELVYLPEAGDWACSCGEPLAPRPVDVSYLGSGFRITLLACSSCSASLVPESLATGKMAQVEALLEDK